MQTRTSKSALAINPHLIVTHCHLTFCAGRWGKNLMIEEGIREW